MYYQFKEGFRPGKLTLSPDEANAELERIRTARGAITAPVVVEESRPETAPLHAYFEWDDAKAGEEYRISQARRLVRAIVVVETPNEPRHSAYLHVPASVTVSEEEESGRHFGRYEPVNYVIERPNLLAQALGALKRNADGCFAAIREVEILIRRSGAVNATVASILAELNSQVSATRSLTHRLEELQREAVEA